MSDYIKSALELLKLAPRYLVAVGAASALLLFASEDLLQRLGLKKFTEDHRAWLGIAVVSTSSLLFIYLSCQMLAFLRTGSARRRYRRRIVQRLEALTEDEKQILRYYLAMETRSNTLKVDDGVVQGLVMDGIIFQSAALGNLLEGFAHNISDEAWDYLNKNPHILEGTTNLYRTDKRKHFY